MSDADIPFKDGANSCFVIVSAKFMKRREANLRQSLIFIALIGMLPLTVISLWLLHNSINKTVKFSQQEMRGSLFLRPLEQLLDLLPRYRTALAKGNETAALQGKIDEALSTLAVNYNGELGKSLKFTDVELAARKRSNARLDSMLMDWRQLKSEPPAVAATDAASSRLEEAVRAMIAHSGDLSNLILDSDLDSYYLMDAILLALPQTQQRTSDALLQIVPWIKTGQVSTNRISIAVIAAMLQQADQDRLVEDFQTSLAEDKNFYGISITLQTNIPPAVERYLTANKVFIVLLQRLAAGGNVSVEEIDRAGWAAHSESFRLWKIGVGELDQLLVIRLRALHQQLTVNLIMVILVLVVTGCIIWLKLKSLNAQLSLLVNGLSGNSDKCTNTAGHISETSQILAEGASEQAASIEETSASLEELSSMTRRNADNSKKVNALTKQARIAADKGASDMRMMHQSMRSIQSSSDEIAKIIKTIDEIAFQTNILALNAAVESARAGDAGLGFAVVADEVRNLAQRSAAAAKETAEKIESAINKTAQGVELSDRVLKTLDEIVTTVKHVDELAAEVSVASQEQTQGITQINLAIGQMDKVTQTNAANAEESAAAAQELFFQAKGIKKSVTELVRLAGNVEPASTKNIAHIVSPELQKQNTLINWDEVKMSTGVASVDSQHQVLIRYINQLHVACLNGVGKEELVRILNAVGEYAVSHFKHEETIMQQHRCPVAGKNKSAHEKFLKDFKTLSATIHHDGASTKALIQLKEMLADWLQNHICRMDTGLRSCSANGIACRTDSA